MTLPPPLREEASLRRWIKNTETPFVETWSLRIKTSRIPWLCDVTSSQSRVQVSGTMAWRVSHQHGTTQSISPVAVGWLQRSLVFLCEFMYCSSIEIITNNNYTYIYEKCKSEFRIYCTCATREPFLDCVAKNNICYEIWDWISFNLRLINTYTLKPVNGLRWFGVILQT